MSVDQERKTRHSSAKPDPFVGRSFDGYKVEEIIGRGGMGVVYKASQLSLGRPVAIKVLPEEFAEHPQFLERFHREVDILSKLSHPNIVTVFERGEVDGRQYLVMEFVNGTSLREVMKQGPLPRSEALTIVRSVLSALEHAHEGGVVHRDIKPENVLTAPGGIVKVADFGLSRVLGPPDMTRLTHTHLLLGTFEYMAPEQRERAKEADERSDLYATGVVLYEMLAGELPIGHFKLLSKKRPQECDARIDHIVRMSLEKSPDDRYQRAEEMGGDVSRLLTNVPLEPVAHVDEAAATPVPVAKAHAPPAPAATNEQSVRNYLTIAVVFAAVIYAFAENMRDEEWAIWGICVGAAILLVHKAKWSWLKRLFQEWPIARITGKPPKDFPLRVIEDRNVQMHLRQAVPGLWTNFPKGVDFDTDEGRLMLELSPQLNILEDVPQRLASAIGRVLEKTAPEYYKAIAVADAEWEDRVSALAVPAFLAEPARKAAPRERNGLGGLAWAVAAFVAGFWMLGALIITGFDHALTGWLLLAAVSGALFFVTGSLLWRSRWVMFTLTFVFLNLLAAGGLWVIANPPDTGPPSWWGSVNANKSVLGANHRYYGSFQIGALSGTRFSSVAAVMVVQEQRKWLENMIEVPAKDGFEFRHGMFRTAGGTVILKLDFRVRRDVTRIDPVDEQVMVGAITHLVARRWGRSFQPSYVMSKTARERFEKRLKRFPLPGVTSWMHSLKRRSQIDGNLLNMNIPLGTVTGNELTPAAAEEHYKAHSHWLDKVTNLPLVQPRAVKNDYVKFSIQRGTLVMFAALRLNSGRVEVPGSEEDVYASAVAALFAHGWPKAFSPTVQANATLKTLMKSFPIERNK